MTQKQFGCCGDCELCSDATEFGCKGKVSNREYYECKTDNELMELSDGKRCEICERDCNKNLGPSNPSCEGSWCEEALEYWLDEEYEGDK